MERKIRFRGKSDSVWVYGNFVQYTDEDGVEQYCIVGNELGEVCPELGYTPVDPATLGQFTGLHDKNGKEIYEGDIITVDGKYPKVVKWIDDYAAFCIADIDDLHGFIATRKGEKCVYDPISSKWWMDFANETEVTGNVHDNPKLLEKGGEE